MIRLKERKPGNENLYFLGKDAILNGGKKLTQGYDEDSVNGTNAEQASILLGKERD